MPLLGHAPARDPRPDREFRERGAVEIRAGGGGPDPASAGLATCARSRGSYRSYPNTDSRHRCAGSRRRAIPRPASRSAPRDSFRPRGGRGPEPRRRPWPPRPAPCRPEAAAMIPPPRPEPIHLMNSLLEGTRAHRTGQACQQVKGWRWRGTPGGDASAAGAWQAVHCGSGGRAGCSPISRVR